MKTKIVLWGENEKDEKILLGIELVESENVIRIHTIPEEDATEIFYNQMMNQWREGQVVLMPESTTVMDRPLSMTEGLLPDNIKTQRQDILTRAKTEWHFVILSSKLYEAYADEISQIKERIDELQDFDGAMWEEMKAFWKKVQNQVQEKNLFREHAIELRTKTNELFDKLKSLKRSMNDEFEKASKEHLDKFYEKLNNIEERIEKGLGLQPIFNELKNIQFSFKDTKFTRKHHNDVWKRIDSAFKKVKEKKFGGSQTGGNSAVNRLTRRYDGLLSAIDKMEQSINRDKKDKQFQEKRINTTDGQLELQIRQAKMAMIVERINSKQIKLDDMLETRIELEKKIEIEKERTIKKEEKREQAKEVKKAKENIKDDIAKEIESKSIDLKEKEDKLQKAAESIKESKIKKDVLEDSARHDVTSVKTAVSNEEDSELTVDSKKSETPGTEEPGSQDPPEASEEKLGITSETTVSNVEDSEPTVDSEKSEIPGAEEAGSQDPPEASEEKLGITSEITVSNVEDAEPTVDSEKSEIPGAEEAGSQDPPEASEEKLGITSETVAEIEAIQSTDEEEE